MAALVALEKKFVFMAFVWFLSVLSISEALPGEGDRNCRGIFEGGVSAVGQPAEKENSPGRRCPH
jgi:hypothetical protein